MIRRLLAILLAISVLAPIGFPQAGPAPEKVRLDELIPAPGMARSPSGAPVRSDRLLVKWRPGVPARRHLAVYRQVEARLTRHIAHIDWEVIEVAEHELYQIKARLTAHPDVLRCDFSHAYRLAYVPNDPLYPSMWAPPHIRADRAWDSTFGSSQVVIAIMDTGIDITHVDLDDNIWTNPGEIPGNGIDDDANGYIDDVHGYDFAYDDPVPDDNHGHGTGTAGLAAAEIDNMEGIVGIAPGCRLMACKCGRDDGYFFDDAVAPAFIYAADMGARVTSNSYYGDGVTPVQKDAVDYAYRQGVLNVVAAGNDNRVTIYYPAGYDACLAVASLEANDTKSWFSNYGTWVDVLAPGNGLLTTYVGDNYGGFAGTSGACPHVAGLAALVFSMHPEWGPDEVRARINNTSVAFNDGIVGRTVNYGIIDCEAAVNDRALTTPPRAALVWVSPIAAPPGASVTVRARSLDTLPGTVRIGMVEAPADVWTNERVETTVPLGGMHRSLEVQSRFGAFSFPSFRVLAAGAAPVFAATDISISGNYSDSARLSGGFAEMVADDGQVVSGVSQSDGVAAMDVVFQKLATPLTQEIALTYTRTYLAAGTSAVEHLYLYDFDTGSYPYGSYEEVATFPITAGAPRTDTVVITNVPERFRSYESNIFLAIRADTGISNATFEIDQITLAAH